MLNNPQVSIFGKKKFTGGTWGYGSKTAFLPIFGHYATLNFGHQIIAGTFE